MKLFEIVMDSRSKKFGNRYEFKRNNYPNHPSRSRLRYNFSPLVEKSLSRLLSKPTIPIQASVLNSFGNVIPGNISRSFQIGNGSGHL